MFGDQNASNQTANGSDPAASGGTFGAPTPAGPTPFGAPAEPAAVTPEMSTLNAMAPAADPIGTSLPPAQPATAPDMPGAATADPTMSSNYVDAIATTPPPVTEPATDSAAPLVQDTYDSDAPAAPAAAPPLTEESSHQLSEIKQDALQQLSPLVNHLEQTPEEKFRTTMMMLQATDNHELVKTAYEAAQAITDEKARARALLDVVNEINYFHQQEKQQ